MANLRHGLHGMRLYNIWNMMMHRCENPKNSSYPYYGGRGIKVCDDWKEPKPFVYWAFGSGYTEILTLERINNDGDYKPENCAWITRQQQNLNTRRSVRIEAFGETKTLYEWSIDPRCKPSYPTLRYRIVDANWKPEKALTFHVR